jgi:glutamate-1-semialdehyde 2,1-aminomutase
VFVGHPSLFTFWLTETPPADFRDWLKADHKTYERIVSAMNGRGILPDPDMREPWFLSASHSEEDIAQTAAVLEDALAEVLGKRARYIVSTPLLSSEATFALDGEFH